MVTTTDVQTHCIWGMDSEFGPCGRRQNDNCHWEVWLDRRTPDWSSHPFKVESLEDRLLRIEQDIAALKDANVDHSDD